MYPRLLLVLLVLAGIFFFLRWFLKTPAETIARYIRHSGIILASGILLYLVATGRLHWLFALLGSLLPFGQRILGLLRFVPLLRRLAGYFQTMHSGGRPTPGQRSQIETRFLRMMLDHDTGRMNGEVLEGTFRGRHLNELTLVELLGLLKLCRSEDRESAILLESYLDKMHGGAWSGGEDDEHEPSDRTSSATVMDHREALEILGLSPGVGEQEIIAAHRRLMQKLHPDRGGSNYLASKLNQAKDVLLGR